MKTIKRQTNTNETINTSKSLKTKFIIPLLLLSLVIFFSLTTGTVSAAVTGSSSDPSIIYVNSSLGNDDYNGTSWQWAKKSIKNATGTVAENGAVNIADGTYTGENNTNIQIDKNVTITGQSQTGTVINGTNTTQIFQIMSGVSVIIGNLTITNGSNEDDVGGAIYNAGNLTISGCTFTNNNADYGGAIWNDGSLTIYGSTFTNNIAQWYGGAICNGGTLTISGSTFTNNTAQNRYGIEVGGAIYNFGSLIISGSTFTNNTAPYGGAIFNQGNGLTISGSTFTGNTAQNEGGAIHNYYDSLNVTGCTFIGNIADTGGVIYTSGGDVTSNIVKFNRIVGNTGNYDIYSTGGTVNAENNWWGTNFEGTNPITAGRVNSNVDADPWIVLTINANPTTINKGSTSTVTVDLQHNSNGDYLDPASGHVPDGIPVTLTGTLGSLNPTSSTLTNGQTTSIFTATALGTAFITATVDNQTVSTQITINKALTTLVVKNASGANGQKINITATLTDQNNNPLTDKTVTFTINGHNYTATTDSNGIATLNYTITQTVGSYIITAAFGNDSEYADSTGNGMLTVDPSADLYLKATSSNNNPKVGETVLITYKLGNYGPNAAENVTIMFQIPEGLEFVDIIVDSGKWTYNSTTRTVTWTLDNVPVGDPYLYLTVMAASNGSYKITPSITSTTYNWNSGDNGIITINVQPQSSNGSSNTVKAASKTVSMQKTGLPVNYLIMAILMVIGGLMPRKK